MKIPSLKTIIIINIIILISFTIIYIIIGNQFKHSKKRKKKHLSLLDALDLSFSIQTKIGFKNIIPKTNLARIFVLLHQSIVYLLILIPNILLVLNSNSIKILLKNSLTKPVSKESNQNK